MKQLNRILGSLGEGMAAEALIKEGYEIIAKNYQNRFGEIDIVAKDDDITVFVEVKTKKGEMFGQPEEMINQGKLNKIRLMGKLFMGEVETRCRIDVVAIVLGDKNMCKRLTHYKNVY